jgi:hypothetical protein
MPRWLTTTQLSRQQLLAEAACVVATCAKRITGRHPGGPISQRAGSRSFR